MDAGLRPSRLPVVGNPSRHEVQFYQQKNFLASKLAQYVETGLERGEGVLILGEEETAELLWSELSGRGLDPEELRESGRLVYSEARELLSRILERERPEPERFESRIGSVVSELMRAYGSVRAYVELVNVLLQEGSRVDAALEMERLWNRLLARKPITLLCGYGLSGFADASALRDVSERHNVVHPAEHLADLDDVVDASRLMGELQHRAHLLESESRERRALEGERSRLVHAEETARTEAELATAHIGRLQMVTAALSEAATPSDIAAVIVTEMAHAADAEQAILAVPAEDGLRLRLLSHAGLTEDVVTNFGEFSISSPLPVAAAYRTGAPVWLDSPAEITSHFPEITAGRTQAIVCLPLSIGKRRIGAVGFGYFQARHFTPTDRALFQDLARQAGLALERSRLLQRAEQANQAKDEFLAMLGHELRNPLSPIVTSLQLVRLRGGGEAFGPELDIIERQVRNLVRLVDDLLDISRITQGRVRTEPETIDTAEVVARAVELARPLIEQRSHHLEIEVGPRPLPLTVDSVRIAQALSNIVINAAKYTPPGGEIRVEAERSGSDVQIRIIDDGPGISPELMPRLFDLFVQGKQSLDRRQGGLGIGLTVARSLIELHGGRVSAASRLGEGSEFTVRLPLGSGGSSRKTALPVLDAVASDVVANGKLRVLIVEDNEDGATALAHGLARLGYVVSVAHDPESGIERAKTFHPHFALIDIGLPAMDGYELVRRLRSVEGLERLRSIAITGYGSARDRLLAKTAGFEAHLVKPVDLARLDEVLKGTPKS